MLVLRIKTDNPLRVSRKFEIKMARLLAVSSDDPWYTMWYAIDEYDDLD